MPPTDSATRFESTEAYYAEYRPGYGDRVVDYLADRFDLDADSRVLDLGCGAGQIAVPLAEHAGGVVGMDPNETMLEYARERAEAAGQENVEWRVGSDADLDGPTDGLDGLTESLNGPADDLGPLALTTMGRSFHWMDQERTLERLHDLTEPDGGVALVNDAEWLRRGTAGWQDAVYDAVCEFLDDPPERTGPVSYDDDPWDEKLAAHGFEDVETRKFAVERAWTVDDVVGYVFSLSYCSPDRFGDDQAAFEECVRTRVDEYDAPLQQNAVVEVVAGRR